MARRKVYDPKSKEATREYDEITPTRRSRKSDTSQHLKWWLAPKGGEARAALWQFVDRQRATWSVDAIADLIAEAIYNDTPITAGGRLGASGRWIGGLGGENPLNVIKSLVDTGTARLTKVRSMPVISADDAEYDESLFAREQSRVLRRKMGSGEMEFVAPLIVRDFIIRGTAYGKIERCGGDTEFRRVPAYEVVYDRREALYGLQTYRCHVRPEGRDQLIAKYPKMAEEIAAAPAFTRIDPWMTYTYVGPNVSDMVEVAESWHPPSSYDADDGQWILCLRNKAIARAPWNCLRDPLRSVYWTPPTRGLGRGTGLVYEQAAAQSWINDILQDAREAIHHGSQLKIFQPRQGGSNKHHLKARHPAVIEHDGAEPHYVAPDPVSKQAWAIAFQMAGEMYNTSGISQWSAQAKASLPGTPSGRALETMDDQQSDRFAHVESGYQQWRVSIGQGHVDVARMMHDEANGKIKPGQFEEQPDPIEKSELAAWIRDNEWPNVDIDGGDYHLTLEPENFITGTRGGKLNNVNEAAKAGLIPDPSLTAALFDEPDIARANRGILGPVHRIERCLSDLSKPKVPYIECAPDPEMNLALAKVLAQGELEEAKSKRAPEVIQQRFRDFISDVKRLMDDAKGAPSLQGAQQNNIVAQGNAADLLGSQGGPPPGSPPPNGQPPGAGPGGMPAFGDGGVVTKPTVALVGEKGPEAVVPLDPRTANLAHYLQNQYGLPPGVAAQHAVFYQAHSDPYNQQFVKAAALDQAARDADPYGRSIAQQAPIQPSAYPAGFIEGVATGRNAPPIIPHFATAEFGGAGDPHRQPPPVQVAMVAPAPFAQGLRPYTDLPIRLPTGEIVTMPDAPAPPPPVVASK